MGPRLLHYSDVENAYDHPERVGRLAGLLQKLDGEDALVAGSGDNTSPGVLALAAEGRQAIPFFEAAGTDVETFGNHDFDYGPAATRELVADSPQQWVSANVRHDGGRFGADVGVEPWTLLDADGASVGVVGLTAPETNSINPEAADLTFEDPVDAAAGAVEELRAVGADYVVALSHLGERDADLAALVEFDAVLGGHVHSERDEVVDGTVLTRPGAGGRVVYEVDLATRETTRHCVAEAPLEESVLASLADVERERGLRETVARVEKPIDRSDAVVGAGECRVGNFVADAYRWATGADVGLQNAGGLRHGDQLAGEVTVADLYGLVPFEEPVTVVELSGERLRQVFAEVRSAPDVPNVPRTVHGHVSGAELTFEPDGALRSATVGGEPLDDSATYELATSDYLLFGELEFPTLTDAERASTHGVQYEVVAEYARETGVDPDIEGRIDLAG